jgi:3-hydroxyisobutyrate dehydrogenase
MSQDINERRKRPSPAAQLPCKDDLKGSLAHAWELLLRGATDRRSAFHICTVATVDDDGHPRARGVVLRDCNPEECWLRFNTDRRSPKLVQMVANPEAAMLFYDEKAKIQLRLKVRLEPMDAESVAKVWEGTPSYSRQCYQVTQAPGTVISEPSDVVFDAASTDDGEPNFAPIRARVESIEWLYLAAKGHRRARFEFGGADATAQWLVP